MKVTKTYIEGLIIIEPIIYNDKSKAIKNREIIKFKPSELKYEKLRVYDHLIYLILPKYLLIYYQDLKILIRNLVINSFYNSQTYAFYNFKKIVEVKKKLKKIYNSL